MASLDRTKKFYLFSICSVFIFTIIGKILFVLYRAAASDILIVDASSFLLRCLPYICSFGAELFSRGALVMAVCSATYRCVLFRKKNGWQKCSVFHLMSYSRRGTSFSLQYHTQCRRKSQHACMAAVRTFGSFSFPALSWASQFLLPTDIRSSVFMRPFTTGCGGTLPYAQYYFPWELPVFYMW